jgi:hypothetical protein
MTPLKPSLVPILLALGACSPTAQSGGSLFYGDVGTEAAILAGSTAAGFDPTGASSMVMAQVNRAALEANARKQQALYEQQIRESDERLQQLRENLRRNRAATQRPAQTGERLPPAATSN